MSFKNRTLRQRGARAGAGFTLVELLIVISIIGILIALIMPAVNSARESGRRAHCSSNLKQMAMACLALESKYQHLPGGGWGWMWAGDVDRDFGANQPGGWHFNILPFIDLNDLHDMGKGTDSSTKRAAGQRRAQTVVPLFICPTRRKLQVYPRNHGTLYINIDDPKPIIARSDYAGNAGSNFWNVQPGNANSSMSPSFNWSSVAGTTTSTSEPGTGVIYRASATSMAMIKDGPAYTYMIGERYLCPTHYYVTACDNDQGWDLGYDYDVNRGTVNQPLQDREGISGCRTEFGSAHAAGFHMAFCDGSVMKLNYEISPTVHRQLGHRADGQPTQLQDLNSSK
jgi:prepilin-type N-terminal cleavage/methylation domain-containing protein